HQARRPNRRVAHHAFQRVEDRVKRKPTHDPAERDQQQRTKKARSKLFEVLDDGRAAVVERLVIIEQAVVIVAGNGACHPISILANPTKQKGFSSVLTRSLSDRRQRLSFEDQADEQFLADKITAAAALTPALILAAALRVAALTSNSGSHGSLSAGWKHDSNAAVAAASACRP